MCKLTLILQKHSTPKDEQLRLVIMTVVQVVAMTSNQTRLQNYKKRCLSFKLGA
jgi:hypothetical protein